MKRKIMSQLLKWKENPNRKPLVLNGARQVGKTYVLRQFGGRNYENVVYLNLEINASARHVFDGSLDPNTVIAGLETLTRQKIKPDSTLLILDEIQSSPRALTSLKAFNEEAPQYHVVAAGSLLGVAIKHEQFSFPVGMVDEMRLYPLDFEEYLWALGYRRLGDEIRAHYELSAPMGKALHETALSLYKSYLVSGGMPASVKTLARFSEKEGQDETMDAQGYFTSVSGLGNESQQVGIGSLLDTETPRQLILNEYAIDMTKYATHSVAVKIQACFESITQQLAKENKKFQYKVVQHGGSASIFGESLDWLFRSGTVLRCQLIEQGILPIAAYVNLSDFKIYMSDVGLLVQQSQMPSSVLLSPYYEDNTFMGGIVENYVAQSLVANGHKLYYWKSGNTAEVDFVIQLADKVVPIEVKKGRHTKSRSLEQFVKKYAPEYSIRLSSRDFGLANGIKSVPLYAAFCI